MALSAASPIYRGYLSDYDCRWSVIAQAVDDRTREERGLEVSFFFFFSVIAKLFLFMIFSHFNVFLKCFNYFNITWHKQPR